MTSIEETRTKGTGSNFSVLSPEDGYRKDDRLWFGECSECGERVTNSLLRGGVWHHTIYTEKGHFSADALDRGFANYASSREVDYCPTAKGETNPCVVWFYDEDKNKVIVS
jgi:hypothetical protein